MDSASYVIAKPSWFQRWGRGWVIIWRNFVFNFWTGIYSLPGYFVAHLLPWHSAAQHPKKLLACVGIVIAVALVNFPLAYGFASETTGYFRSKREQHDQPPPFPD
jgi:hypothetical protein